MNRVFFIFLIILHSQIIFAQFADDFSDGNFTANPSWIGDSSKFEVDSTNKLHTKLDTLSGEISLVTQSKVAKNATWEFESIYLFEPSASNYARVYLMSDQQDLKANLNGYFVRIGGVSGVVDDVCLYSKNGNIETKIIDGIDGIVSNNQGLRIKVTRDDSGNWELFTDTTSGNFNYFSEGTINDNTFNSSDYFGVYCKYTKTRSDEFFFDNFLVSGSWDTITIQQVVQNEIIINEVFADPAPTIGLPEYEYIELYNSTNSAIELTDWAITIGTTEKIFPSSIIEPDSFVILIKEDVIGSFPSNISKIGFSSIALTNAGADIILKDNHGATINSISYSDKWYNDDDKIDGGWSIEKVNPDLFCEGKNNWKASVANIGGTPGKQNSVFGGVVFIENFRITNAIITDSNKVRVYFNKSLDSLGIIDGSLFDINGNAPILSVPIAPFFSSVNVSFDFNFLTNTTYTISANGLEDCSGMLISNSVNFGVPDSAVEKEIILNEVLFNPKDNGVDYLEIYNNSNSFFDLSKLRIANFFEFGGQNFPENSKIITEEPILLPPKTYCVLTTDSAKVKAQYSCENPYNFIEIESMPILSNDTGTICIVHQSLNQIIDAFAYSENMHFSLLETEDGVSLERLDFNLETQNNGNWHSSASTIGFGTPTFKNSQQYIIQSIGEISVDPKSFTPNNDGYKDICSISWSFSKSNLMATINIFDADGRLVSSILNNQMIGNEGSTIWDGTSEDGLQLNTGMYIVWMEVFSDNGNADRFKEVIVLSR
ncbi:lamin tail domain-containing protein [Flavobacteriales bacterium]|nr:lamin tail domain-containing protein [Flavobacteriales bacterium]